jgi:hypothetical protein
MMTIWSMLATAGRWKKFRRLFMFGAVKGTAEILLYKQLCA